MKILLNRQSGQIHTEGIFFAPNCSHPNLDNKQWEILELKPYQYLKVCLFPCIHSDYKFYGNIRKKPDLKLYPTEAYYYHNGRKLIEITDSLTSTPKIQTTTVSHAF